MLLLGEETHWEPAYERVNRSMERLALLPRAQRDHYTWAALHTARLAQALQIPRVTVIEFGVFAGDGLVALEQAAIWAEQEYGVTIDVVGFDSGEGLMTGSDPRDLPNIWPGGAFSFDSEAVQARLQRAQLVVGWVAETLPRYLATSPAPIGFIAFDLDRYTATADAFEIFRAQAPCLLPRVHCYFDDIMGYTIGDYNGERLAIAEFNDKSDSRWLSPIYGLQQYVPRRTRRANWVNQIYLAHITDHPLYAQYDGLDSDAAVQH